MTKLLRRTIGWIRGSEGVVEIWICEYKGKVSEDGMYMNVI